MNSPAHNLLTRLAPQLTQLWQQAIALSAVSVVSVLLADVPTLSTIFLLVSSVITAAYFLVGWRVDSVTFCALLTVYGFAVGGVIFSIAPSASWYSWTFLNIGVWWFLFSYSAAARAPQKAVSLLAICLAVLLVAAAINTGWYAKFFDATGLAQALTPLRPLGLIVFPELIEPNQFAGMLLLGAGLVSSVKFSAMHNKHRWLVLLLLTVLLVLTQSRTAWLAVIGTGVLWRYGLLFRRNRLVALGLLSLGALTAIGIGWRWQTELIAFLRNPPSMLLIGDSLSFQWRQDLWAWSAVALTDFPLTGVGLDGIESVVHLYPSGRVAASEIIHAHNQVLQTGLDLGLIGLGAFVMLFAGAGYRLWQSSLRVPQQRMLTVGLMASMCAFGVFSLTDAIAIGSPQALFFWIPLGIAYGITTTPPQVTQQSKAWIACVVCGVIGLSFALGAQSLALTRSFVANEVAFDESLELPLTDSQALWLAKQSADATFDPQFVQDVLEARQMQGQREQGRQFLLGKAYAAEADLDTAFAAYVQAEDPIKLIVLGWRAAVVYEEELAADAFQQAYQLDPERTVLDVARYHYFQTQDYDRAIQLLTEANSEWPESLYRDQWLHTLGLVHLAKEEYAVAERHFLNAIDLTEDSELRLLSQVQVADIYAITDTNAAQRDALIQTVIETAEFSGEINHALGDYHAAHVSLVAAQPFYAQAVVAAPARFWWHIDLATSYFEAGNEDAALIALAQTDFHYSDYYAAVIHAAQGEYETAKTFLNAALAVESENVVEYWVLLGDVERELQNPVAAQAAYEAALQMTPENTEVKEKLDALLSR